MKPSEPLAERQKTGEGYEMRPGSVSLYEGVGSRDSWDYGCIDRRWFARDHEGFFKLCIQEMGSRNSHILMERWFDREWHTLEEIGRRYDICRERVRSIEYKAFRIIFRAIKAMWEGK